MSRPIYQIPLATFNNPNGLTADFGQRLSWPPIDSGTATLNVAGYGGFRNHRRKLGGSLDRHDLRGTDRHDRRPAGLFGGVPGHQHVAEHVRRADERGLTQHHTQGTERTMAKSKEETALGLPVDRSLPSDFQRVVTAGRPILRIPSVDEKSVTALTRETARRLSEMPPESRLADRNRLLSLFDDVNDIAERLNTERARAERELSSRNRHRAARRAYLQGSR